MSEVNHVVPPPVKPWADFIRSIPEGFWVHYQDRIKDEWMRICYLQAYAEDIADAVNDLEDLCVEIIQDIEDLDAALAEEKAERIAADAAEEAARIAAIAAEEAARIAADNTLQANIDAEEAARIAADDDLSDALAAEIERATGAEDDLQDAIDAEAAAREQYDYDLELLIMNQIDIERNARIAMDVEVQAQIDQEVLDRVAAILVREDKLNKQYSYHTWVSNDIKYPTTAAIDARFEPLSNKTDVMDGDSHDEYPTEHAVKTYVDNSVNTAVTNLTNIINQNKQKDANTLQAIVNKIFGGGTINADGTITWGVTTGKIPIGDLNIFSGTANPASTTYSNAIRSRSNVSNNDIKTV